MTRKDEFLRAIQLAPLERPYDLPLAFGLALNLAEQCIPPDLPASARQFVAHVSSSDRAKWGAAAGRKRAAR